jgi:CBS domain-containing protein
VGEARARFLAGGHGAYPVLDGDRLVGIVSRGDILADEGHDDDRPVTDLATDEVVTVRPDDGADVLLRLMATEGVEHVPVVDAAGALVGIATRTDLLAVRRRHFAAEDRPGPGRRVPA